MKLSEPRRRLVFVVAALATAQAVVVALYLLVEHTRSTGGEAPFPYERLTGASSLPPVDLTRPNGSVLSSAATRGQPVLLHFWATWCPPCREELPGLLLLSQEHPGLRVVAITVDEDWATVRHFFDGPIPAAVVRDPSGRLVKQYEVGELPATYLLDEHGAARARMRGARNWTSRSATDFLRTYGKIDAGVTRSPIGI